MATPTVELRAASAEDAANAHQRWETRLRGWLARQHHPPEAIDARFGLIEAELAGAVDRNVHLVEFEAEIIGSVSTATYDRAGGAQGDIEEIWIAPEHRGNGFGGATRRALEQWLRREWNAVATLAAIDPSDPVQAALFAGYRLQSQRMLIGVDERPPLPEHVTCRPFPESEFEAWRAEAIKGYAESIAESGALIAEEALQRSTQQFAELLPDGLATPGHAFWAIDVDEERVAMIWVRHRNEPGRSFVLSVQVTPEHRGKGYGKAIMRLGERLTFDAGDSHLALNVFGQNATAIGLYTSLGYTVTDQSRILDLTG